jgi:hypothetical protein
MHGHHSSIFDIKYSYFTILLSPMGRHSRILQFFLLKSYGFHLSTTFGVSEYKTISLPLSEIAVHHCHHQLWFCIKPIFMVAKTRNLADIGKRRRIKGEK